MWSHIAPAVAALFAAMAYTAASQFVAVYSVVEIGPNLLAAVTSVMGFLVLVAQLRINHRVRRDEKRAGRVEDRVTEVERKTDNPPDVKR